VSNLRKIFVLMSLYCLLIIHSLGALAKNGSFGFLALGCVSVKTKCAICAVGCPFTMRHNVLQLPEGRDFHHKT
jgi:hypothetical protein